jgi:PilZ domain
VAADVTASEALKVSRAAEARRTQRREERVQVVRHVEYTPFPRVSASQRGRVGFTRDVSSSGLCLRIEAPERVGSLLRVAVRGVDGRPARIAIARVAWSSETRDGAWWAGLQIVEDCARRILRVEPAGTVLPLRGRRRA